MHRGRNAGVSEWGYMGANQRASGLRSLVIWAARRTTTSPPRLHGRLAGSRHQCEAQRSISWSVSYRNVPGSAPASLRIATRYSPTWR